MNRQEILDTVYRLYPHSQIKSLVLYGNLQGRDIDLLLVLDKDQPLGSHQLYPLDIMTIGHDNLDKMIAGLDPCVVEPFLLGQSLIGHQQAQRQEQILSVEISEKVVAYLMEVAEDCVSYSINASNQRDCFHNLFFALSYIYYAGYYRQHSQLILFKQLINLPTVSWLRELQTIQKSDIALTADIIMVTFERIREYLTDYWQSARLPLI